jgi:hypothetical protein
LSSAGNSGDLDGVPGEERGGGRVGQGDIDAAGGVVDEEPGAAGFYGVVVIGDNCLEMHRIAPCGFRLRKTMSGMGGSERREGGSLGVTADRLRGCSADGHETEERDQ